MHVDKTIPSVLQGDETLPEADHEDAEQVQGEVPHVHQEADEKFGEQAEQPSELKDIIVNIEWRVFEDLNQKNKDLMI